MSENFSLFFFSILVVVLTMSTADAKNLEKAVFAGGCFWCLQPPYDEEPGVISVAVGYTGGFKENPTYEEVSSGKTGHFEAVEIAYDPAKTSFGKLLDIFWRHIDPTADDGQFVDIGPQYRTAVFYANEEQKKSALASKSALNKSGRFQKPIATKILPVGPFYKAEEYHQGYYKKSRTRYKLYKDSSGREAFFKKAWPAQGTKVFKSGDEWRRLLTVEEFHVLREKGTERAFTGKYHNYKGSGLYVCAGCGQELFKSDKKFDSGTGWPSFWDSNSREAVTLKDDPSLGMKRMEVLCARCAGHLGHVFDDGPPPTGKRYCINSAALKFKAEK